MKHKFQAPCLAVLFGGVLFATSPFVHAARIWDGGGTDNNSNTAANWDDNVWPTTGPLTFAGTTRTTVVWNGINSVAPMNMASITFAANAGAFQINQGSQTAIQYVNNGVAILNNSSNLQTLGIESRVFFNGTKTFNAGTAGLALDGGIIFRGDSMLTGQTNRLDLIGSGNSTTSSISRLGGFAGTATTSLVKNGLGKWTVTGNNTDTGSVTITQGTLEFQGSIASSSISNNSALILNNAATQSYANAISGSGTLTKQGAGSFTLSNTNLYNGATTISGGTLNVTGSLASAVTVEANGAIGSNGGAGARLLNTGLTIEAGGGLDLAGATLLTNGSSSNILNIATGQTLTLENLTFADITGWEYEEAAVGTYQLIAGDFNVVFGSTANSVATAIDFGNGKSGYFTEGSLNAVIINTIPEPTSVLLGGLGLLGLLRRRR